MKRRDLLKLFGVAPLLGPLLRFLRARGPTILAQVKGFAVFAREDIVEGDLLCVDDAGYISVANPCDPTDGHLIGIAAYPARLPGELSLVRIDPIAVSISHGYAPTEDRTLVT